jgi:hypothetical protein
MQAICELLAGYSLVVSEASNTPFGYYNFPAKHWRYLGTANGIESGLATVRAWTREMTRLTNCNENLTISITFR